MTDSVTLEEVRQLIAGLIPIPKEKWSEEPYANNQIPIYNTAAGKFKPGAATNALLDGSAHTDTAAGTVVRGDLIVGNSTPKWARLALGASGTVLFSNAIDAAWKTPTFRRTYVFHTTAAWNTDIVAGVQKGYHHTTAAGETAIELIAHCDTRGANSFTVTVEISNGNDLGGSPTWATVNSITMTASAGNPDSVSSGAISVSMAGDRMLRLNIGTITSTAPQNLTVVMHASVPLVYS